MVVTGMKYCKHSVKTLTALATAADGHSSSGWHFLAMMSVDGTIEAK
jgi:hypothetical protein